MSITNNSATDYHSNIAEYFDNKYKDSPDFIERFEVWTKFLAQYICPKQRVLDAGCGSGTFSFFLASKGVEVLGVDGAKGMVDLCNKKKRQEGLKNIEFMQEILPLDPTKFGQYDVIISSSVLEYISSLEETIYSFSLLLPTNGHLIISLPNNQSFYRKIESLIFKISGKPAYYKHVHNKFSAQKLNSKMNLMGFDFLAKQYYAANYPGSNILKIIFGKKYTANLFLAVYKKR